MVIKQKGPADDICNQQDCITLYANSCKKLLPCGHQCLGTKYEKNCLDCLNSSCKSYVNNYDLDEDSYCAICYTESLSNGPVIKLTCKHIFHYKCVMTKLKNKWLSLGSLSIPSNFILSIVFFLTTFFSITQKPQTNSMR